MNYSDYNNIIAKLQKCLEYYDRIGFYNNNYSLNLANGDFLSIKVLPNNISHLLGVNMEYLNYANKFKPNMNTYEKLNYFLEEAYSFANLVKEGKLSYDSMFSDKVKEKLDAFIDNINIRIDDVLFIIKYDPQRTYQVEAIADISDYYIVRKNDSGYLVLGLIKNENSYYYVPVTSRKYTNYEELTNFLKRIVKKQDITYPYYLKVENRNQYYSRNFFLHVDERINLIGKMNNFAEKNDATISIARDYLHYMNKTKTIRNNEINIIRLLNDHLSKSIPLDQNTISEVLGQIEISEDVQRLIEGCNQILCLDESSKISNADYSLTKQKEMIEELEDLKQELILLKAKNQSLEQEKEVLEEENNIYKKQFDLYEESYQKIKSLRKES